MLGSSSKASGEATRGISNAADRPGCRRGFFSQPATSRAVGSCRRAATTNSPWVQQFPKIPMPYRFSGLLILLYLLRQKSGFKQAKNNDQNRSKTRWQDRVENVFLC